MYTPFEVQHTREGMSELVSLLRGSGEEVRVVLVIAFFNFFHKRPTFAFTSESGYTLGFRRKIAHEGSHGETRGVLGGGAITTLGAFRAFRKPCAARYQNGKLCRFGSWLEGAPEACRESLRNSDALMRVAVPKASRPRWAA